MLPLNFTFVIRLQLDEQASFISGQINAVRTQETTCFPDLDQTMAFIEEHLEERLAAIMGTGGRAQPEVSVVLLEGSTSNANGS